MTESEQIYQAYFRDVYLYVISLCSDAHVAEDITSETFIKAMQAFSSFRGDCDIRVWLCQIAKNCYYSRLRQDKRLVFADLPEQRETENQLEELLISQDTALQVHRILHGLAEPYKEVFYLRVFGELSFKQIASVFGKSDNWACVIYHRARKKIQKEMEDSNEPYL
ncbi:MAG: sigma-70 family RNA polymerase sigma factor [Firmicutes bacterium]|nr:sigma-70 family RNA polymerase sigma factor [Bacillota bacterium]